MLLQNISDVSAKKSNKVFKNPLNASFPEDLLGTSSSVAPKSLQTGLVKELPEDLGKGRLLAVEAHQEEVQPLQPWDIIDRIWEYMGMFT